MTSNPLDNSIALYRKLVAAMAAAQLGNTEHGTVEELTDEISSYAEHSWNIYLRLAYTGLLKGEPMEIHEVSYF